MSPNKILLNEPHSRKAKKFKGTDPHNPQQASVDNVLSFVDVSPKVVFPDTNVQEKSASSSSGGTLGSFPQLIELHRALPISSLAEINALKDEIASLGKTVQEYANDKTLYSQTIKKYQEDLSRYKDDHSLAMAGLTESNRLLVHERNKLEIKRHELRMKIKLVEDNRQMWVEWGPKSSGRKALIKAGHMHFVDRDLAARQLLHVHNQTFNRSGTTAGIIWEYGICANDLGCGKSEFAENYISHISQLPVSETSALDVYPLLRTAVTLHICLRTSAADRKNGIAGELLQLVKEEVNRRAVKFVEYSTSPREIKYFLSSLVSQSDRPIFLVIDEVAAPFFHPQYLSKEIQKEQTEKFKIFIRDLILPLLQIRGLFLLLCGKAPFLDWLGTQPNEEEPFVGGTSAAATRRIVLNMIRPDQIILILQNTFYRFGEEDTSLQKYLNLNESAKANEYAEQLYQISGGHPRTICQILLNRCLEIEATRIHPRNRPKFFAANEGVLCSEAIELLRDTIFKFSKSTAFLVRKSDGVPRRLEIRKAVDGITYEHLLPPLRIGLEILGKGYIRLHIPDQVRVFVESFVSPLYDFLRTINMVRTVPIDFSFAFELLVAKSFNFNFKREGKPSKLNSFFFDTPFFGNWNGFICDNRWRDFPKVTASASSHREKGYTVSPERAKDIVEENFGKLDYTNVWLLPRPQSSSPDLIHLSKSGNEKRIMCIAVKNFFRKSRLSEDGVMDEINKAENMIPIGNYVSVLIVACTQYGETIQGNFGGSGSQVFPWKGGKIKEVILLNLSSPHLRAKLCGKNNPEEIPGLEILVQKTQVDLLG